MSTCILTDIGIVSDVPIEMEHFQENMTDVFGTETSMGRLWISEDISFTLIWKTMCLAKQNDVKWAPWGLKSWATRLLIQQFRQPKNRKLQKLRITGHLWGDSTGDKLCNLQQLDWLVNNFVSLRTENFKSSALLVICEEIPPVTIYARHYSISRRHHLLIYVLLKRS